MIRSINLSLQQKFHQWTPSPARKLFFHTPASSLSHLQLPILTDKEKKSWTYPTSCLETLSAEKRITSNNCADTLETSALKTFTWCSLSFVR